MEPTELGPSLRPILREGETILFIQKNVGIYKNSHRDKNRDSGDVYLTSHHIFYVDDINPRSQSVSIKLSDIVLPNHNGRFLRTSAKVSFVIKGSSANSRSSPNLSNASTSKSDLIDARDRSLGYAGSRQTDSREWRCTICSHVNKGVQSLPKCKECGIMPKRPIEELLIERPDTNIETPPYEADEEGKTCPACTFLNHHSMSICEICETNLLKDDPQKTLQGLEDISISQQNLERSSASDTLAIKENNVQTTIRLSFRSGGSTSFYSAFTAALEAKAWEKSNKSLTQKSSNNTGKRNVMRGTGISNVLNQAKRDQETNEQALRDGFADLEALTERASDMVALAEQLSRTIQQNKSRALNSKENKGKKIEGNDNEESSPFTQYLIDIGLENAITKDAAGDAFHEQIAHEVVQVLENYMNRVAGEIPLIEAYCIYNRARSIAPISPMDFVRGCEELPRLDLGLEVWTYPNSGFKVLRIASSRGVSLDDPGRRDLSSNVMQYVKGLGSITALELAVYEDCSVTLATEHLTFVEAQGYLCRDESVKEIRFYENIINTL
ncbi:Vacuolar protein-sorting-associated protein 36 [Mycoemilia scoparia]|uniref:Vacuolar protein-sorting-associated protein 36 n=1 Tax=Mycoemilia scoparia TaxID=417184 RepID=A0A9W7ZZU7_9FUNG|nr:Vacuolar protein-sorting-associated protein 36 [Mycoemilia scoparia]